MFYLTKNTASLKSQYLSVVSIIELFKRTQRHVGKTGYLESITKYTLKICANAKDGKKWKHVPM